jgi:hypothetical protein
MDRDQLTHMVWQYSAKLMDRALMHAYGFAVVCKTALYYQTICMSWPQPNSLANSCQTICMSWSQPISLANYYQAICMRYCATH